MPKPKITARRMTAYAQAGLQNCDDCGRPGWSIDGVTVLKHQDDADDAVCPGLGLALRRAAERFLEMQE